MATNGDTTLVNNASAPRRLTCRAVALEQEILSVLDAKPRPDEGHELAFGARRRSLSGSSTGSGLRTRWSCTDASRSLSPPIQ